MPRPGPAPKPAGKRERRNVDTIETTELGPGSAKGAPALPGARKFRAETRAWYRVWASSPQAAQFLATDWLRLHMLASLVDRYFADPDARLLGEIRLNEAKLGGTADDRLRLRWRMAANADADERAGDAPKKPASRRRDPRLQLVESS